ncbi:MAG: energy-coupled thiamine transporter ThiT [Oscillospiraceae bacterium]
MKAPSQMSRTAILVEAALMVALSFVLSLIPFFELPWGGSITCFSTLPIILVSLRHSSKWGLATATVYGFLQMLQGIDNVVAAKTLPAMVLCALLDYILAYACVGLTGAIARRFKNPTAGLAGGIVATGLMRLACSFLSGILIWGAWAPEGVSVWWYSLSYNMGWCLPDVAIVLVAALLLSRVKALHLLPEQG